MSLTHVVNVETSQVDSPEPPGVADDRRLLERFRLGEPAAFEAVVALHHRRVARLVQRLLGPDRADVEDVVQEVFADALAHCRRFRRESSLGTWLTALTINACRRHRRRRLLWWKFVRRGVRSEGRTDAELPAEQFERHRRVRDAVERLPGKYREVVVLRYLEEMEIEDIAIALALTRGAVEVRLHRAREGLRGLLKDVR